MWDIRTIKKIWSCPRRRWWPCQREIALPIQLLRMIVKYLAGDGNGGLEGSHVASTVQLLFRFIWHFTSLNVGWVVIKIYEEEVNWLCASLCSNRIDFSCCPRVLWYVEILLTKKLSILDSYPVNKRLIWYLLHSSLEHVTQNMKVGSIMNHDLGRNAYGN